MGWLIRQANRAHRHPSPWVRRPVIVAVMVPLALRSILFWLCVPFLLVFVPVMQTVVALFKSLKELPAMLANTFGETVEQWQRNLRGARNVWRYQYHEPRIMTKAETRKSKDHP